MSFPKKISKSSPKTKRLCSALGGSAALLCVLMARAELPAFLQHVPSTSDIEAALFRAMELPGVTALYPRPPKEAQGEMQKLLAQDGQRAELYSLKAMEDEQALDLTAAEADWKAYADHAKSPLQAKLKLADYYHRRLQAAQEVRVLMDVGAAAPAADDTYVQPDRQKNWKAFSRVVALAGEQAMDAGVTQRTYEAWLVRYPKEEAVYAMYFDWLLEQKQYDAAAGLVARYRTALPNDATFPVKATALVALRRGSVAQALAVYDANFQPLWPQELLDSYYALLAQTHEQRSFLSAAQARLEKDPDDFGALERIYFYEREAGRADAAQAEVDRYRMSKDARKAAWSADELNTLMLLMERGGAWPEAARYAFALYNLPEASVQGRSAQEAGLASMTEILLKAPEQPIALGRQNLTMYRDIATLDQGPGYWNGILSLWMNSSEPAEEYHAEEVKAQPYFHRAKAAALLQMLDAKFPQAAARPELHARLIAAYAGYGEGAAVIEAGTEYLREFPQGDQRVAVAMQMADAYARQEDTKDEFALYDRMLTELGAKTQGMPLTAATNGGPATANEDAPANDDGQAATPSEATGVATSAAFEITAMPRIVRFDGAAEYSEVLERYLGRLVAAGQMQAALGVLREELDRNPNDPLLYERLATFLQQNNLSAQQEEIYKAAIAHFADKSWYDKLARLYLREKREQAYADLTREVTNTFAGTELEAYFQNSGGEGPQMFLQMNLYAAQRFPHDLMFVRNLLDAYSVKPTRDEAARLALLRKHWWETDDLRVEFFETLSRSGDLDAELRQLQGANAQADPAAGRELAEAQMWRSHFEESAAPLGALEAMYPADRELGEQTASVFRSLAYYDSAETTKAVAVEKNLLAANPGDLDRLATLGDVYADAGAVGFPGHEDLTAAAPYWRRMAEVHPGSKDGYLQAATVFWDYFEFDNALEEIEAARKQFGEPTLFGYEAGAICEGKRDYQCAVKEYVAAAVQGNSEARDRLLTLAAEKNFAGVVDDVLSTAGESDSALSLREDVLHAQGRDKEIGPLLEAELNKAATLDDVATVADRAHERQLAAIYEQALEKEIRFAVDPVQKIELQLALAQSEEGRKDDADAARVMAGVYAANPKLLGVVRATVDFYWRTGMRKEAIATLVEASKAARPDLGRQFALEAASKANESGEYAEARAIVAPLMDAAPYGPQIVAIVADSYARAGDDAGLRDFYAGKIAAIKTAAMTADEKKQTTLLLRRGLIPALTRMKDYAGGVDQYIAMLSAYPEDTNLALEASLYALRRQQKDRLAGFVQRTVAQSPRDSRFAAMLAQVETVFEDYPAAIDAWSHAVSIRADKQEWFAAKADLELRLGRLDEACADYERLYVLSYKNPDWMVDEARVRAQQGRKQDAVAALEKAWMSGHPAAADDAFKIAAQLEAWNMLEDSRGFAEQGTKLAGDDLLTGHGDGASTYMEVMTRLRRPEGAWSVLDKALEAARVSASSPSVVVEQVQRQGLAGIADSEWRVKLAQQREATAQAAYDQALKAMGRAVGTFYTPEEKAQFAAMMADRSSNTELAAVAGLAGLKDLEAKWMQEALLQTRDQIAPEFAGYVALQRARMLFLELGKTMESYAAMLPKMRREPAEARAAADYRDAGDDAAELRVMLSMEGPTTDSAERERLFALLLKQDRPEFFKFAVRNDEVGDAAANYALAHDDEALALQAVAARGTSMQPVWNSAYRALTGLYFADTGDKTDAAFRVALADGTIGDRLSHPPDRSQSLAGDPWFYYGLRYAVFRFDGGPGDPEDYAASELEHGASFANYVTLAHTYADAGKVDAALVEYRHALELQPQAASLDDAMAALLWKAGRRAEAVKEWQIAIASLRKMVDLKMAPDDFFVTTALVARHAKEFHAVAQLHGALDELLKAYLQKNGNYRSNELLRAAYEASATPAEGMAWVIELSAASKQQAQILADLKDASWLSTATRAELDETRLELARSALAATPDDPEAAANVVGVQVALVKLYADMKDDARAKAMLAEIPAERQRGTDLVQARVMLAARDGSLKTLLEVYDAMPEETQPAADSLRAAASQLEAYGDASHARDVLEFVFARGLLRHELTANDYLALAEVRLKTGDMTGTLDLLQRMTLLPAENGQYNNDDLAAGLLERSGHWAEAIPFLKVLADGLPWDSLYAVRLAEARLKAAQDVAEARTALAAIAGAATNDYSLRARAALDLRGAPVKSLGSKELDLLAETSVSAADARQPYFVKARMAAAGLLDTPTHAGAAQQEPLLREAIAIAPDGEDAYAIRIGTFRADDALGHDALAMAAINPLLGTLQTSGRSTMQNRIPAMANEAPETDTDDDAQNTPSRAAASGPSQTTSGGASEHASLLAAVSDVCWRMGNMEEALRYLRTAVRLEAEGPRKTAWRRKLAAQKAVVRRTQQNALRRPKIHAPLDQSIAVKPRLVATKEGR